MFVGNNFLNQIVSFGICWGSFLTWQNILSEPFKTTTTFAKSGYSVLGFSTLLRSVKNSAKYFFMGPDNLIFWGLYILLKHTLLKSFQIKGTISRLNLELIFFDWKSVVIPLINPQTNKWYPGCYLEEKEKYFIGCHCWTISKQSALSSSSLALENEYCNISSE